MGVDNRGCREQEDRRSGISRRKLLAGSLATIGASSNLVTATTKAEFQSTGSASGDVQVAELNVALQDNSRFLAGVQYQIIYQVVMETGYDGIEITVDNTSGDSSTYTRDVSDGQEGVIQHTADAGAYFDTFEFTFEVSVAGAGDSNPVLTEALTDSPDGTNPPGDDMGGSDDPTLESFTVMDLSNGDDGTRYDVSYQVADAGGFDGEVQVHIESTNGFFGFLFPEGNQTMSNDSVGSGTVSYPNDGETYPRWGPFGITVEVVKDNGIVVDSGTVTDEPDGNGTSWSS
ncbi:hypothetical protein SAMN05216559_2077 [Halomicrobium zhouii]|uniref:Uncharacterized protein n=1 Tax=Halomicrobium zhouii TaxID=767519 RepID=A0A1I6L5B9_9EURY|nr:hypothetical protein [Halomicrobium zhouii]SFR98671.1 hypothetical protein SAMN05216559_2077 [Halomicrobium zhouii]